jgi:hypothetical protein
MMLMVKMKEAEDVGGEEDDDVDGEDEGRR